MAKPKKKKCPFCRSTNIYHQKDGNFWCRFCKATFDSQPNEGGSHYNDPTKRLERQER